ncbi:protein pigeon [Nasonia vitripennis]|uniref:Gamma-secretase-activating protein C-terminal domain-containing protein n=1 Tax=Nasonia vitripennis TaxID=7425 RepID=A0A7M7GCT5_NASVI|nr:protein pigeon [Nasonia vitripennis]
MEENLAAKLCLLLGDRASEAVQWKLLGQEKDGSLLLGWVENVSSKGHDNSYSVIGRYDRLKGDLQVLHRFSKVLNLIQATVNQCHSLLGYVTKQKFYLNLDESNKNVSIDCEKSTKDDDNEMLHQQFSNQELEYYQAYIIEFKTEEAKIHALESHKLKQVRIQFLYKERSSKSLDKLLVLVHQEYVQMHTILYDTNSDIDTIKGIKSEILVKSFIWAQWDATNQVLYHIHHKKAQTSVFTDDAIEKPHKPPCATPTLSGLQFHDDLPHETVLNIPLNLPQSPSSDNCGTYEDDVIPLRIHDCSLDLIVISDYKGAVCVCHHYLYRPVQPPQHVLDSALSDSNTVHFAYSVTVLHHSCVIHCVVPGIPWTRAKLMRPTFALYGDSHMVVFVRDFFTHLLEIGLHHQPCCHILSGPLTNVPLHSSYLVPLLNLNYSSDAKTKYSVNAEAKISLNSNSTNILTIDLPTLDLVTLTVPTTFLVDVFKKETSTEVRLGILHYFLCHKNDLEIVAELISSVAEKPRSLDIVKIMQEFLIGGSNSLVQKNLLSDAVPLLALVPVTTMEEGSGFEAKINDFNVTLSHEKLWNTSVMLLSPQQRLVPYRSDLWTRLWDLLSKRSDELPRFKPSHIAEKLLVSLACYQPEALSRCSTPMSPSGGFSVTTATLGELMSSRYKYSDGLPFIETESCTASKQEHIVSVNLRELSLHLLKYGTQNALGRTVRGSCTPLQVHALSTRHVASQLETSRLLCQMLCKAANVDARVEPERGFCLIDQLEDSRRWLLFTLLERYRYATESIAFPVPQGFMSFFTYLGYRTLKYSKFLQYVRHSVFELQVDVAKIIMADIGDTKESVFRKLELLSLLPRTRAKRLLNQWLHPMSFMLRAREHAANILSGELCQSRNRLPQHRHHHNGISAFPSTDRLSPLDTFLDLLTAKASLTELDFGLLIEATVTSTEDFL